MKRTILTPLVAASLLASGCAQSAKQIEASYVSPGVYSGRSCNQLMAERNDIARKVNGLVVEQDKAATNDAVLTGVALLVFWPAAIGLAVTKDNATALSAAKGNYDAITEKMASQGCAVPAEPVPLLSKEAQESTRKKRSWE